MLPGTASQVQESLLGPQTAMRSTQSLSASMSAIPGANLTTGSPATTVGCHTLSSLRKQLATACPASFVALVHTLQHWTKTAAHAQALVQALASSCTGWPARRGGRRAGGDARAGLAAWAQSFPQPHRSQRPGRAGPRGAGQLACCLGTRFAHQLYRPLDAAPGSGSLGGPKQLASGSTAGQCSSCGQACTSHATMASPCTTM